MRAHRRTTIASTLAAATAVMLLAACGSNASAGSAEGDGDGETINIVGFAVPEAANTAIAEEFVKTPEGEGVQFKTSYGASGDQSRAVVDGLDADYVHFSVASDVTRLVDAGLIAEDWDQGENAGIVSTSIVVLGVREGNPLGIEDWDDLVQPGVEIVTPNPASSGAARWNALAAWGSVIADGGTEEDATEYINQLFGNVVSLTNSGRDATTSFLSGTGDVLLAYENEAILAAQNGQGFEYVIPETTIKIENPGAVLIDATPAATDWLSFVLSDEGQTQFALKGFRPLRDDVDFGGVVDGAADPNNPFPPVTNLLTVEDDFGSWSELSDTFFDEDTGIVTEAIAASGQGS